MDRPQRSDIYYFCGKQPDASHVASMLDANPSLVNRRADAVPHPPPLHYAAREGHLVIVSFADPKLRW
jgi:hypothetical protein